MYYCGMTNDISRRLDEHNNGMCRFTSGFTPWVMVYSESFRSRKEARNREKYFKTTTGRREIQLILKSIG